MSNALQMHGIIPPYKGCTFVGIPISVGAISFVNYCSNRKIENIEIEDSPAIRTVPFVGQPELEATYESVGAFYLYRFLNAQEYACLAAKNKGPRGFPHKAIPKKSMTPKYLQGRFLAVVLRIERRDIKKDDRSIAQRSEIDSARRFVPFVGNLGIFLHPSGYPHGVKLSILVVVAAC